MHRTKKDWAAYIREVGDVYSPQAPQSRLGRGDLHTHTGASLYGAVAPQEARWLVEQLEFHYTPTHASGLTMAAIEIGVLSGQCLDRRLDAIEKRHQEIAAWEQARNAKQTQIHWTFTI
jgi:hypothetical protein